MLKDPYITSSNFRPQKSSSKCNVKEFYEEFEKFYTNVRAKKSPDLPHTICDPYGFALLCLDYDRDRLNPVNENVSCKDSFIKGIDTEFDSLFKYKFPFEILLSLLYRAYYFDYNTAINVYNMQKSAFDIFNQIMNGQGYVMNRLSSNKKKVRKLMNHALNSRISLNDQKPIDIPFKSRLCNGMSWPCIVSEDYNFAKLEWADIGGYGTGLFLIGNNNKIYDVLKINDLWLVDTPLENRLKFASSCRGYDVIPYMKSYSWRSTIDAARIMKCNKDDGVLVRPCHENFFSTNWFSWARTSAIYCCLINGKLQIANRKTSKPDYYTLEGDVAELDARDQRVYEKIWLDDFDIKEFQQILKLKEKIRKM